MTTATITDEGEVDLIDDDVVLTLTDGETYTTRLSKIFCYRYSWNESMGAGSTVSASYSGRIITFNAPGAKDNRLALTVKGTP